MSKINHSLYRFWHKEKEELLALFHILNYEVEGLTFQIDFSLTHNEYAIVIFSDINYSEIQELMDRCNKIFRFLDIGSFDGFS